MTLTPFTSANNDVSWQCGDHAMPGTLTIATGSAAGSADAAGQAPPGELPSVMNSPPGLNLTVKKPLFRGASSFGKPVTLSGAHLCKYPQVFDIHSRYPVG